MAGIIRLVFAIALNYVRSLLRSEVQNKFLTSLTQRRLSKARAAALAIHLIELWFVGNMAHGDGVGAFHVGDDAFKVGDTDVFTIISFFISLSLIISSFL